MHIAEVVTIAKSLPLLRLNTYKSLILSYSADYRRIFRKNTLQSTNAQIARMLCENAEALGISKSKRILSENFHGKRSVVQEWKILMVWLTTFICLSVSASAQTFSSIPNPEENNQTMNQMRSMIRDKDYLPQNLMVNGNISVIDTLKAKKMYEEIREELRTDLNNGNEQLSRLTKLLSSTEKKIKDEADLFLVNDAFSWVKSSHPDLLKRKRNNVIIPLILSISYDVNQTKDITPQIEKSIQSKKLTNHIKEILRVYQTYLTDSVIKLNNKLSSDKWEQVVKPLPMKTINTNIFNPYYRGFNYYDSDLLDLVETEQQRTWDFIYSSNYEKKEDSYPQKKKYLSFDGYPQYKVTYYEDSYTYKVIPRFVYDTNGNLVYVASLTRNNDSAPFQEMRRLVYLRDYLNNKYGIKSQSKKTQNYLQLLLCRDNGFERTHVEALASVFAAALTSDLRYMGDKGKKIANGALKNVNVYNDSDGKNYIAQLEKDHDSEFGSVYMIERLSNVSFRIVYLDTQLKPSHCAIITYMTGDKPFTQELSGCLVSIPNNLPPLIDCSGEVYKNVKKTQN